MPDSAGRVEESELRVLMLADSRAHADLAERELRSAGIPFVSMRVDRRQARFSEIGEFAPDVILLGLPMPRSDQISTLRSVQKLAPSAPIIIVTGTINEHAAVECIKAGAADYVIEEHLARIGPAVKGVLASKRAKEEKDMVARRTEELRRAHEQLVRQEKLAAVGQLACGLGHELRNPLGAIKNAVYFLNMALEAPGPDVKETLALLNKEVAASERIISSLLDFDHAGPTVRREADINALVLDGLSRTNVPDNVEVARQLDEALPTILADPDRLVLAFANIILNAVQAMPEGGRLVLKSHSPAPGWAVVDFTDTGPGISKENLPKVFEPLFTTKARGIGLGLALTKTLVEAHGGAIEVQGEVGKGAAFTVKLPVCGEEKE